MPEPLLGTLRTLEQNNSRKHRSDSSILDRTGRARQLHHLYEQSCDARPRATALICGSERLSYAELDARANQVAHYLVRLGVRPGDRVGLLYERSTAMYEAMLGVLKCGAAFVPLDPSFPADRVGFIADDASLRALLTTAFFESSVSSVRCQKVFHNRDAEQIAAEKTTRPDLAIRGDGLCYIIYTSGTTGRPKGVAVNQSNICQFLKSCKPIYGVTAADRVYQGMTIAFDFSIEEIWPTFKAGATLVAGPNDHRRFGAGLNDFLIEQRISVVCCVPTLLATLERDVPSLRLLLVGGEACPDDLVKRWSRPGRRMLNTYGPTETTVTATWSELLPDRPVTIGRPFPTSTVYILDNVLQPVLPGHEGEICIGGPCVAPGYVNRPELTAERFVRDPYSGRPGARLYRTGDLGRVNLAGEIEYLGRIDTQVKIRGMRVELGEIEAAILEDPGVLQVVATSVSSESGAAELAAYVVSRNTGDFLNLRQRLHESLRRRLPAYMIPVYIEPICVVPMLPSQKADRSQLPRPVWPRIGSSTSSETNVGNAARTPIEEEIAAVWARIFRQEIMSVEIDFFLDLGGHSLFAALAVSALREKPAFRHLAIADLYANPTVRGLARRIEAQTAESSARRPDRDLPGAVPKVRHSGVRVLAAGAGQIGLLYLALIPWLAPTFLMIIALVDQTLTTAQMILGVGAAVAGAPLVALLLPIAAKWLLLGRVKPRRSIYWPVRRCCHSICDCSARGSTGAATLRRRKSIFPI
jgi:amino acid adenylation domain-containing protein